MYFVYMIRNSANKLYTGITTDPERRVLHHNQGRGAQFTQRVPTFELAFLERYATMAGARRREMQIKRWRRDKKELLIYRYQRGLTTTYFEQRNAYSDALRTLRGIAGQR